MTSADKRLLELLDRWLISIDLHLKYLDLDEASYRQVQSWPEHERPARWILELAQQKISQLKTLCKSHAASNDPSFAEALDLMHFLATLVGVQNIKRFIPLADPTREQPHHQPTVPTLQDADTTREALAPNKAKPADDNATRELPKLQDRVVARGQPEVERTRELPKLKVAVKKPTPAMSRSAEPATKKTAKHTQPAALTESPTDERVQELVIADAVRLLKWGREWHELTELIARMAERPGAGEIRRILRTQKTTIEAQLRG
jgi:hypothetical protein